MTSVLSSPTAVRTRNIPNKKLTYLIPGIRDEGRKKVRTFAALLAKQLVDNKWEDGESEEASNATPSKLPPPRPRLSRNEEVWQQPQSAPARSETYAGDAPYTLISIENVNDRRYGDKRKPCHVCYKVHNKKVKS